MSEPPQTNSDVSKPWLDRAWDWFLRNLRPLAIGAGGFSLLLFAFWLSAALVWPAVDKERSRVPVVLTASDALLVDFPRHLLADGEAQPIYLTVNTLQPVSATVVLSGGLPLVLVSAGPAAAVQLDAAAPDHVVVSWPAAPITSTDAAVTVQAIAAVSPGAPSLELPNTVALNVKNANTAQAYWGLWPGFSDVAITVAGIQSSGTFTVGVENRIRAQLRSFAVSYPFIGILPLVLAALSFVTKSFLDYRAKQIKDAESKLECFLRTAANAERNEMDGALANVERYGRLLAAGIPERLRTIRSLADGHLPAAEFAPPAEPMWAEAWVGALFMAEERRTAATPGADADRQKNQLRRMVRLFPRDPLTFAAERRLHDLAQRLEMAEVQTHDWPLPASPPPGDRVPDPKSSGPRTLRQLALFPGTDAACPHEQSLLFAEETEWYWPDHPVQKKLATACGLVAVFGEPGSGRTALALSLTQYAHSKSERQRPVLGAYHAGPARLANIRSSLAKTLLAFVRWRSTWLRHLEREDRDLLAQLLLAALDRRYLLAQLNRFEAGQFVATSDTAVHAAWEEQARLELRLLCQSIERSQPPAPLPGEQWFWGVNHCAGLLGFGCLRVALDLAADDWRPWRDKDLPDIQRVLGNAHDLPFLLVVMLPRQEGAPTDLPAAFTCAEMEWDAPAGTGVPAESPLANMLNHRLSPLGNNVSAPIMEPGVMRELVSAARGNPRALGRIWQRIEETNPGATEVTYEHVQAALAAKD